MNTIGSLLINFFLVNLPLPCSNSPATNKADCFENNQDLLLKEFAFLFINDFYKDVLKIPEAFNPSLRSSGMWDCGQQLDLSILSELATQGCLRNISRLDILLSMENISRKLWKVFMPAMVSLVELNITVLERKAGYAHFICLSGSLCLY